MGSSAGTAKEPVLVSYSQVAQPDAPGGSCLNCVKVFYQARCCGCLCFLTVLLLFVPQSPVWQWGCGQLKDGIEYEGEDVTGVKFAVGSVSFDLLNLQADLWNIQMSNPAGYLSTPYFMHCKQISADVSLPRLLASAGNLLEIEDVTLRGVTVFVEQQMGLTSNVNYILAHISKHPWGKYVEEKLMQDKRRKYIIKRIHIVDMHVHVGVKRMPVVELNVPPMLVSGIGVKENGVVMEELIGLTVNALSVSALDAEDQEVKSNILSTMKDLRKNDKNGYYPDKLNLTSKEIASMSGPDRLYELTSRIASVVKQDLHA